MKNVRKAALAASAFACAALFSFGWSEQGGISLSIESAQAQVDRPMTPAGAARRHYRRAAYVAGGNVGLARYGGSANDRGGLVGGSDAGTYSPAPYPGGASYQRAGYYAGGPYYGGSVPGYRPASYGGYPSPVWGGVSSADYQLYLRNLRDSGYNPKNNFNANGLVATQ
jgi:hypothetical protein